MSGVIRSETHLAALCARLEEREPVFSDVLRLHGAPPLWRRQGGFEALARVILEQQVSLESARGRLEALRGRLGVIAPETVSRAGVDGLRACGITRQKADYISGLANEVLEGRIDLDALGREADDEAIRERLLALRGVGPWSVSVYLLLVLGRTDVWPPGDVALLRSYRELFAEPEAAEADLLRRSETWRPYRSVAARLLWHAYLSARGRSAEEPSADARSADERPPAQGPAGRVAPGG